MKATEFFIAVIFSILFAVALVYATLEVPMAIHRFLLREFPDTLYFGFNPEVIESLRPFGYSFFAAAWVLVLVGFAIKRLKLSTLGSITLYLPTFGYFASTMFFLAGIGILRLLWLPLLDISPNILRLGDIVYLPYFAFALLLLPLAWIFHVPVMDFSISLSLMIVALGLAIFLIGMFTWFCGRFKGFQIIDFWIYRYSRHPQYLGFLLWSYGLALLTSFLGAPMGGYVPPPSLPCLVSALIIVGVALHEENIMVEKHGVKYIKYREATSFMLPLPKRHSALIVAPAKIIIKKKWPENGKEIVLTLSVYGAMLVLLSLMFRLVWA